MPVALIKISKTSKIDQILLLLAEINLKFTLIAITETWSTEANNTDNTIIILIIL